MRLERMQQPFDPAAWAGTNFPPVVQQIYANRGITTPEAINKSMDQLLSPVQMGGIEEASEIIASAIIDRRGITIAGDYDCDGATGTSVGYLGLKMLGADPEKLRYAIPNRDKHGYGLSVGLVDEMPPTTELIVTVDSGVASHEGVAHAKAKGYTVVITDHHLPGETLPAADAIVNPNLKGDPFPSKMLAGVGVMFYVLAAVRARLKTLGHPGGQAPLQSLLDLVAIGTVADLVPLDQNNRILVEAGLRQIRTGNANVGVDTLLSITKRDPAHFNSTDIAFTIAPRLNSAGRLADMTMGVQLLTATDRAKATQLAEILEDINLERKGVQAEMQLAAETLVALAPPSDALGVVVFDPSWHHGIVGLVASKLKESLYRPTVAFAPGGEGSIEARGSARSIPGLHLRDALALIDTRYPGILVKFGGHAMAAGMTVNIANIPAFTEAFNQVLSEMLTPEMLESVIRTDGELDPELMGPEFTKYLEYCGPWGQGFPKPVFDGIFEVKDYRILGQKHVKFELYDVRNGNVVDAIWFFGYKGQVLPTRIQIAYELSLNVYKGREECQLLIRHLEPAP